MNPVKRKSVDAPFSLCVQPAFIIGTENPDGSSNFAPITWISVTCEDTEYLLVISMFGEKRTKQNALRTKQLSVNLVSKNLLPLMDYFGAHHGDEEKKDQRPYHVSRGVKVHVPVLDESRWIYDCEVEKTIDIGKSTTFFCRIRNIQMDERLSWDDPFQVDLTELDPVIDSGKYHSIGRMLGNIGDYLEKEALE